jgi:hypothetical protein
VLVHQGKHTLDQVVAAIILKLPQTHSSNMSFFVGVASRAPQRTFPRDLNGERRPSAAQDALPSLNDFACVHYSSFFWSTINTGFASAGHKDLNEVNRL